jgi:hypothetical protein
VKNTNADAFLAELTHPLKPEILELRQIILSANRKFTEHIKWNAPSYCIDGEDRVTFNLKNPKTVRLILHCGVKVKARKLREKFSADLPPLLDWVAEDRAVLHVSDMIDVMQKKRSIIQIINEWVRLTS